MTYSKIGEEQTNEDAEDGPPELLVLMRSDFVVCLLFCCFL